MSRNLRICIPRAEHDLPIAQFAQKYPVNLGCILHSFGQIFRIHKNDSARALEYFDASAAWLRHVREMIGAFGMTDVESEHYEALSLDAAFDIAIKNDPATALARYELLRDTPGRTGVCDAGRIAAAGARIFVTLVNEKEKLRRSRAHRTPFIESNDRR